MKYDSENLPHNLIHAAQDGKLVFFIGAGVSRLLGGYSWNDYALNKLNYLFKQHIISFHDKKRLSELDWVCQEFCVNRFNKQHRIAA